jgi:hypothetical protein
MLPFTAAPVRTGRKQKAPFSSEEDIRLRELVQQHGNQAWGTIAANLPGRTTRQCRERWNLYLSPEVQNAPWTIEEEESLVRIYLSVGPRWALISQHIPGHNPNSIKNRMKQLLRRGQKFVNIPARPDGSLPRPEAPGFPFPNLPTQR